MFVDVHEEIELKLSALNYVMMPNIDSKCTENPDKSISKVNRGSGREQRMKLEDADLFNKYFP